MQVQKCCSHRPLTPEFRAAHEYHLYRLSTGYDNLHETITVLAAQAPGLRSALLAAKAAGYDYVLLDGNGQLTDLQQTFNRAHNRLRAVGERGNSLLKTTFKSLTQRQSVPVEDREHRGRSPDHPLHRARPNHLKRALHTVANRYP